MTQKKRILVLEDDFTVYPALIRMIHRVNPKADIEFVDTEMAAESLIHRHPYDVLLSEVSLIRNGRFGSAGTPVVLMPANTRPNPDIPCLQKLPRYEEMFEKLSPYLGAAISD